MFDFCLAPDTSGDGTGCDNMTCVIVTFKGRSGEVLSQCGVKRKAEDCSPTEDNCEETAAKRPKLDV